MKVALDVSPLRLTRAGSARYVLGLRDALRGRVELDELAWGGSGRATAALRDALWYPLALPRAARGADLLHCPTFRAPLRSGVPLVVTVLDLSVLRHPNLFNRWTRTYSRLAVPSVVRAARRVIAIAEFTKRELVDLLGVQPERVHVIGVPPRPGLSPEGERAEGDYVLAVGTLEPRKNLARAAEAAQRAGVELRVAGARGWGDIAANGVRWLGEVGDDELVRLLRGARALVYPSLYEGFGIPILEAMAVGTPVVTSAGGATEEVAGGAAVLVDPLDAGSIAAGIQEAERRREELRPRGLERAASFAWEDVAERTLAVYREALE
ncbi:MAG TPA: glycosyltransferase family 1 protein [Gaiellaceae bacterium]|nr:glycosyltransferase family 1 protein [Gaiellaceae bacterium]